MIDFIDDMNFDLSYDAIHFPKPYLVLRPGISDLPGIPNRGDSNLRPKNFIAIPREEEVLNRTIFFFFFVESKILQLTVEVLHSNGST